ncbi:MAG: cytochrome c [Polyangiaceae bacterium]
MRSSLRSCLAPLFLIIAASCVPHRDLPPDQIEGLTKLSDVMDVQATIADPQMKKAGQANYTDADWAAFADLGSRIQVTSKKIKDFSKGPEFDGLANKLHMGAESLAAAASAKDAAKASASLTDMKATCKECHSKFK